MNIFPSCASFTNFWQRCVLPILLGAGLFPSPVIGQTNLPPSVYVTSKNNETSYTIPATIQLNAIASDPGGSVVKVEYFLCSSKLAEVTKSPYEIRVKDLPAGAYTFTAKATDNLGAVSETCFTATILDPDSCAEITADFEHSSLCQGYNVSFWSTSSGDPYPNTFEWKVNGLTVSTGSSMNYTFGSATSYTVQLKTGFNDLCAKEIKTIVINDIAGPITGPTQVCPDQQDVVFSIPAVEGATYTWWVNGEAYFSGENTNEVTVDFGQNFSDIHVGVNVEDCYKQSVLSLNSGGNCGESPATCSTQSAFGYSQPCLNQNTSFWDLSTGAPTSYSWKINGVQVSTANHLQYTFANNGTYRVELGVGSSGNICSTSSQTIVLPETAGPIAGPASVCGGHEYVFSVDPVVGASYNWWLNSDAYVVSGQGTNTVTAYIGDYFTTSDIKVGVQLGSCYKETGKTLTGNCSARIAANVVNFPQPFDQQTTVSTETKEKILLIKIFTATGREILSSGKLNTESFTLGETLPAGYYLMQVVTDSGTFIKTLIKF